MILHIGLSLLTIAILVQAFMSCRLEYCNSLFHGNTVELMKHVQSVHNVAARQETDMR
jgi:hypothetical protein